jgi:phosphoglycolate phosphatase
MKYRYLLFDLDGTLIDPREGITNSIKYALGKFSIIEKDDDKLKLFIGPPLAQSFAEHYNFSPAESKIAVRFYREYFANKGVYENKLYTDIEFLLRRLNHRKKTCILATSKPEVFAVTILKHLDIQRHFKYIAGSDLDGTRSEKQDLIRHLIEKYQLKRAGTLMIGDRKHDIIGARKNKIDSIGVLYGYGSREELEKERPQYLCETVMEIAEIIK